MLVQCCAGLRAGPVLRTGNEMRGRNSSMRCAAPYNTVIRRSLEGVTGVTGVTTVLDSGISCECDLPRACLHSGKPCLPTLFCCSPRRLLEQDNPRATCQACAAAG